MSTQNCIPGINQTCLWQSCFYNVTGFGLLIFCLISPPIFAHEKDWLIIFLSCVLLVSLGSILCCLIITNRGVVSLFLYLVTACIRLFYLYFNLFGRTSQEAIRGSSFLCGILKSQLNFLNCFRAFRFSTFSWVSYGKLYFF